MVGSRRIQLNIRDVLHLVEVQQLRGGLFDGG
jgi:hypothetical protein